MNLQIVIKKIPSLREDSIGKKKKSEMQTILTLLKENWRIRSCNTK